VPKSRQIAKHLENYRDTIAQNETQLGNQHHKNRAVRPNEEIGLAKNDIFGFLQLLYP